MTPSSGNQQRDGLLADAVGRTVAALQREYLAGIPAAAGQLAVLRRAIQREPGSVAEAWQPTIGILPADLQGRRDEPNSFERAAHAAVTLYALHQQSQGAAMHQRGRSIGDAVRDLRTARHANTDDVDPVLRRFHGLATAGTFGEVLHHLRGLVTLLRGAGLTLDYGRLAVDLRRLQSPQAADGVRLSWGRSLYQPRRRDGSAGTDPDATATATTGVTA